MTTSTSPDKTPSATRIDAARENVLDALDNYRSLISAGFEPTLDEIEFESKHYDNARFSPQSWNSIDNYLDDEQTVTAFESEFPFVEATLLALSPHWQDRIRAAVIFENKRRDPVTMPDGMFCIYEPAGSPNKTGNVTLRDHAWVASPDEAMLHELLPLYQRLWSAYESQWPTSAKRQFKVGPLNNVEPYLVFRPGTTPEEVIRETLATHQDMFRHQDDDIKAMARRR